jgi:hypothetical protein
MKTETKTELISTLAVLALFAAIVFVALQMNPIV